MQLARRTAPKTLISLVPMIDVMLILLVFFMVTSTYLNLDMIAMVETSDDAPTVAAPAPSDSPPLIIRLGADGTPVVRGQSLSEQGLTRLISDRLADDPLLSVVLLPSGNASTQSLVTVMDTATRAGATRLRLIRLEAR